MFQGSLTSVSMEFQWNFKEVDRLVKRCFKDVSGCFKEFSRKLLLHQCVDCVTRKIGEYFVLRVFY